MTSFGQRLHERGSESSDVAPTVCPFCAQWVLPTPTGNGALMCPACRNTGQPGASEALALQRSWSVDAWASTAYWAVVVGLVLTFALLVLDPTLQIGLGVASIFASWASAWHYGRARKELQAEPWRFGKHLLTAQWVSFWVVVVPCFVFNWVMLALAFMEMSAG